MTVSPLSITLPHESHMKRNLPHFLLHPTRVKILRYNIQSLIEVLEFGLKTLQLIIHVIPPFRLTPRRTPRFTQDKNCSNTKEETLSEHVCPVVYSPVEFFLAVGVI